MVEPIPAFSKFNKPFGKRMRFLKTGIPFLAPALFCVLLVFASCEKTLISHKTTDFGRLDHVPSSVPDSVSDGASYAILDNSGQPTSFLHTWPSTANLNQYLYQKVTVYGQTHTGYLSSSIKQIDVDSIKVY
jgi:hypothetical protein